MPIAERVTDYSVALLKNDIVDYQQVVKLTTETGHKVFIAFPEQPPADWLTITGSDTTAYLERGEFDRIHQLLQTEAPLFLTSINLIGLRSSISPPEASSPVRAPRTTRPSFGSWPPFGSTSRTPRAQFHLNDRVTHPDSRDPAPLLHFLMSLDGS